MTNLMKLILGQEEFTIAASRSVNDCLQSIQTLHRPGQFFQRVDTIVTLSQEHSNKYSIEVSKRRQFYLTGLTRLGVFGRMVSVNFCGSLEADTKGTAILHGKVEYREWYLIGISLASVLIVIWTLFNPALLLFNLIFLVFVLILASWFVRSDKDILLREIEYAVS